MQPHTLLHKNCWINLQCTHAVISLLLQSRKFWWYLLLTSYAASWCHNDVIRLLAIRRVSGRTSSRTVHRHTAPRTCKRWTAASRNTRLSCAQHVASKHLTSQSCWLWDLGCHAAKSTDKSIVWMNWNGGSSMSGAVLEQSILAIDQWQGRHQACVHTKGGHFEYSLWTDNVNFVHTCYIQCDLFDCYIFNL